MPSRVCHAQNGFPPIAPGGLPRCQDLIHSFLECCKSLLKRLFPFLAGLEERPSLLWLAVIRSFLGSARPIGAGWRGFFLFRGRIHGYRARALLSVPLFLLLFLFF